MQKIIVYKTVKQWMVVGFVLLFSSFSINLAHLNKQHRLTKVFYKVKKKVQFRCRIWSPLTSPAFNAKTKICILRSTVHNKKISIKISS